MDLGSEQETLLESWWQQANINAAALQALKLQRELEKQQDLFYSTLEDGYENSQKKINDEIDAAFDVMLYENARRYGLRLLNPLAAHRHIQRLLTRRQGHHCSYEICDIFHIPAGMRFPWYRSNSTLISSGIVFICRLTGSVHMCDSTCSTRYMDPENQSAGYVCDISHMVKGQYIDDLPQGKNVKISRQRIDQIETSHLQAISATNYTPQMGDSDEEDYDDYGDMEPEVQTKAKKPVADPEKAAEAEEEEDEILPVEDEEDFELPDPPAEPQPVVIEIEIPPSHQTLIRPSGSLDMSLKRKLDPVEAVERPPKKQSRPAFELPTNPEERTAHFLKNLDKREQELNQLLQILLSYESKTELWKSQLATQSKSAHEILISYQRRAKNVFLTEIDVYVRWLSYIALHVPKLPEFIPPIDPQRYIGVIMKAWQLAAKSPYARDSQNNRFIPNFVNISLAVLYTMASGGYSQDCSLSVKDLADIPEEFKELDLRTLQFKILPDAPILHNHLIAVDDLVAMKELLVKNVKISVKQKAKGWRSLKECISSTVESYRQILLQDLKQGTVDKSELIRAYIQRCWGLMCRG